MQEDKLKPLKISILQESNEQSKSPEHVDSVVDNTLKEQSENVKEVNSVVDTTTLKKKKKLKHSKAQGV